MSKFVKKVFKKWYFVFGIILIVGLFIFQKPSSLIKTKKENTTFIVKKKNIKEDLSLSGEINAEEKATLRFQTSGKLAWVGVKEGDYVIKYQGVASLDQREVQQNLKKYLNTYVTSRTDYDQEVDDTQIKDIGGLSEDARRSALRVLSKAQDDLNNAVIDVELKNLAIEYSNLVSPIEGIVIKVGSPYAGVNVTPTQAEIVIINPNTVYFSAITDQTDVVKLTEGRQGEIVLDAYLDDQIVGKVKKIAFTPKEGETGTVYEVKMEFNNDNNEYKYRLGMTGDVNFILRERGNIIVIPTSYIKSEKGKKYVWKIKDNKKVKAFIKVGEEINGSTEIKSGLQEGETIQN